MKISNQIRDCDKYGAVVRLIYAGKDRYGTVGGGVASLLTQALVLGYFVKQLLQLANHEDPTVISNWVNQDRSADDETINMSDYSFGFKVGMVDLYGKFDLLDPSIGAFKLFRTEFDYLKYNSWAP